jgi:dynein heavy chain, axonemal
LLCDIRLDDYIQMLEKEVNIDFCWSMNRIIFDKTVRDDPETFAFVTVPESAVEKVPARGIQ